MLDPYRWNDHYGNTDSTTGMASYGWFLGCHSSSCVGLQPIFVDSRPQFLILPSSSFSITVGGHILFPVSIPSFWHKSQKLTLMEKDYTQSLAYDLFLLKPRSSTHYIYIYSPETCHGINTTSTLGVSPRPFLFIIEDLCLHLTFASPLPPPNRYWYFPFNEGPSTTLTTRVSRNFVYIWIFFFTLPFSISLLPSFFFLPPYRLFTE